MRTPLMMYLQTFPHVTKDRLKFTYRGIGLEGVAAHADHCRVLDSVAKAIVNAIQGRRRDPIGPATCRVIKKALAAGALAWRRSRERFTQFVRAGQPGVPRPKRCHLCQIFNSVCWFSAVGRLVGTSVRAISLALAMLFVPAAYSINVPLAVFLFLTFDGLKVPLTIPVSICLDPCRDYVAGFCHVTSLRNWPSRVKA